MKHFNWDNEKSEKLKQERGISFEEIVFYIEKGQLLDILEHPNKEKYKNQNIFVIQVEEYAYLVPFVEDEKEIFLKTIIPSRKATKNYLKGEVEHEESE
ncbi:MAG: BrnT family toxin [Candidatus Aureabacteria bacterium]|nr:BrnT family toxin [Candidatus Auribacterota bacterium]